MSDFPQAPAATPYFSWRNPGFREVVYQGLVLAGVAWAAFAIYRNTTANLAQRGISSGFSFLENEAGFGIGEVLAVPRPAAGLFLLMGSIFAGLLAAYLLHRVLGARGIATGGDFRWLLAALALAGGIPAATFLAVRAGLSTVHYDETGTYGLALATGVFNTVKVSLLACGLATVIGFAVGIARLSSNWLVSRLAGAYVEVLRNIPLLLQIFFWYFAVLRTFPGVQESLRPFKGLVLNNRGVFLPNPVPLEGFAAYLWVGAVWVLGLFFWARFARLAQQSTGAKLPVALPGLGALALLWGGCWGIFGPPVRLGYPALEGFNFVGGLTVTPEFAAMLAGISLYTGAFIAEIVRSGIEAVSRGQKEAAAALGLRRWLVMRLVVIPQALRVIVPPLTSQYLNATKNSSLGVAIAYPELVSVGGTILNQSGQAIEVITIMMAVYLAFSLAISLFMNWYNARVALVGK